MTEKILVLGAGAAGSVVTNKVAREFRQEIAKDEVEITIMDKNDMNVNQGGVHLPSFWSVHAGRHKATAKKSD